MRLSALFATALLSAAALGQVAIPAHNNVYTGYSRGFNFVAQTQFVIVQLNLPPDAFVTGYTASYLVRINGVVALQSRGNAGALATSLPVSIGDNVDIIGNWSPPTGGSFSASNSYGSGTAGLGAAPYATVIEGVPHTLNRTGWQWDVGDPAWNATGTTGTYLAPTTGQIGRVLMTTSPTSGGGTLATNTTLGNGCGQSYASFYENFAAAAGMDLNGLSLTMLPSGVGYTMLAGFSPYVPPSATATTLTLGDDAEAIATLSAPFAYPGGSTTSLVVCSNGFVSVATGNGTAWTPDVPTFLNAPQASWRVWHDFNPSIAGSGQVKFEEIAGIAYVTWDGVYSFSTTNAERFQFQFDLASGVVTMVFGSPLGGFGNGFLVGYSPGGPSLNPGSMDISAALTGSWSTQAADIAPLTMTASTRPIIGTNWTMRVNDIPANGVIGLDLLSITDPNITDLAAFGAPGCQLRAGIGGPSDLSFFYFAFGTTSHPVVFSIPNDPWYVGIDLYVSSVVLQSPTINAAGAITANGIKGHIGTF